MSFVPPQALVGAFVGSLVGSFVGDFVGSPVGSFVGRVGDTVGTLVGNFVGVVAAVGAFDVDEAIVGTDVGRCCVSGMEEMGRLVPELEIEFGILCVPKQVAQEVADRMVAAGIRGILNFTPRRIEVGESIDVVSVDFSLALEQLAYQVSEDGDV